MRTHTAVLLFLLLIPATAFAQHNELTFFAAPSYYAYSDQYGSASDVGYGIGYRHAYTDRFALDASVTRERYTGYRYFGLPGNVALVRYTGHAVPADVAAQFLFRTDGNWKPYVGGGLHAMWVQSTPVAGSHGWIAPMVDAGVAYRFASTWSAFVEARQLLTTVNRVEDPRGRLLTGLRWRF